MHPMLASQSPQPLHPPKLNHLLLASDPLLPASHLLHLVSSRRLHHASSRPRPPKLSLKHRQRRRCRRNQYQRRSAWTIQTRTTYQCRHRPNPSRCRKRLQKMNRRRNRRSASLLRQRLRLLPSFLLFFPKSMRRHRPSHLLASRSPLRHRWSSRSETRRQKVERRRRSLRYRHF